MGYIYFLFYICYNKMILGKGNEENETSCFGRQQYR